MSVYLGVYLARRRARAFPSRPVLAISRVFVHVARTTPGIEGDMMSSDLFRLLTNAERDFRAGMAKLTEVRAHLAALNLPDPSRYPCPRCGISFGSVAKRVEHLYHAHNGPEPAHWLEAEARAEAGLVESDQLGNPAAPPPSKPWRPIYRGQGDR